MIVPQQLIIKSMKNKTINPTLTNQNIIRSIFAMSKVKQTNNENPLASSRS